MPEDLTTVFEHNGIPVKVVGKEKCCGMPKLELGDLETVEKYKDFNIPQLKSLIDEGYDIVAPIPSCVLMFKQELPLMFPEDADVQAVKEHIFDPFEYLMLRHKAGLLRTDFTQKLGKVSYHVPCHLRVQNIGLKTRDVLRLVPETTVDVIERCSGHNGTYAVKKEYRRRLGEDRQAGGFEGGAGEGRSLLERLSDGGAPDRKRTHAGRGRRRAARSPNIRCPWCARRTGSDASDAEAGRNGSDVARTLFARAARVSRARHRAQAQSPGERGSEHHVAVRRPAHGAVPGAGDAAHRAHLRSRGHRRRARCLQPADPGRPQLEGHVAHRVPGRRRSAGCSSKNCAASKIAAGCRWRASSACSRSPTRTWSARTRSRPRPCTSCASS